MEGWLFDQDRYLDRIGLSEGIKDNEDGLGALHLAQILSIPFENFDVMLGRTISLEPSLLYDKLVNRRRGGYCFELNGLFLAALRTFGFSARPLLARVHLAGEPRGRTHQLSLVRIGERNLLADVGFGAAHLLSPIPMEIGYTMVSGGQSFRLADAGDYGTMLQVLENERWKDLYSFDFSPVFPGDIFNGNYYSSTHPDAFFKSARMASLPLKNGRRSLVDKRLRIISNGEEKVETLPGGRGYLDALKRYFGIELDCDCEQFCP